MEKEIRVLNACLSGGGAILKKHFRKVNYALKSRANLLTKADLESQKFVLGLLNKNFPQDDILAEENYSRITGARRMWIVDPLDGTTNYAHGYPVSCVSVGLVENGRPLLGGVYDPFRDELFLARRGHGARLNGKKISVSKAAKLEDSLLLTGFPYDRAERGAYYCSFITEFIKICHDVRRSGSAALDMCWLACGRADGYWEMHLNPWDVSAGRLMIEEAGGKVTDFSGKPWGDPQTWGKETLVSNGKIHKRMLDLIRKTSRDVKGR
jgi:myo-inositol-1(or 4)-monophosphatase